jgi:hypothetical protein
MYTQVYEMKETVNVIECTGESTVFEVLGQSQGSPMYLVNQEVPG